MIDFYKQRRRTVDQIPIFHDFEAFHGKVTESGAMNFLFADFHVGPFSPRSR
jgi:prepilin-type processing-associated H-X9-DG protein